MREQEEICSNDSSENNHNPYNFTTGKKRLGENKNYFSTQNLRAYTRAIPCMKIMESIAVKHRVTNKMPCLFDNVRYISLSLYT